MSLMMLEVSPSPLVGIIDVHSLTVSVVVLCMSVIASSVACILIIITCVPYRFLILLTLLVVVMRRMAAPIIMVSFILAFLRLVHVDDCLVWWTMLLSLLLRLGSIWVHRLRATMTSLWVPIMV